jgi:DNA-binding HxlR family transcriptional regulator
LNKRFKPDVTNFLFTFVLVVFIFLRYRKLKTGFCMQAQPFSAVFNFPMVQEPVTHKPLFLEALSQTVTLLGDKYSLLIIALLLHHRCQRFLELQTQLQGISPRTLSARLKQLEAAGLLKRKAYPSIPPKVEYTLTEKGEALATPIQQLVAWSQWSSAKQPEEEVVKPSLMLA